MKSATVLKESGIPYSTVFGDKMVNIQTVILDRPCVAFAILLCREYLERRIFLNSLERNRGKTGQESTADLTPF